MKSPNLLDEKPFINEYPRNIVLIRFKDNSTKTLFVNNQILTTPDINIHEGELHNAILDYLNQSENAVLAEVYTQKNDNEKEQIGTLNKA